MAEQPAPPGINFKKIVENVISYLVTAVFVGACAIVWRGATTVDDRVHATEKSLQALIDNLSAKLTSYEVQLTAQSNQIATVYAEIKSTKSEAALSEWKQRFSTNSFHGFDTKANRAMIQQDISNQLMKK